MRSPSARQAEIKLHPLCLAPGPTHPRSQSTPRTSMAQAFRAMFFMLSVPVMEYLHEGRVHSVLRVRVGAGRGTPTRAHGRLPACPHIPPRRARSRYIIEEDIEQLEEGDGIGVPTAQDVTHRMMITGVLDDINTVDCRGRSA